MYLATIILENLVLGTQILLVAVCMYLVYAASRIVHLATGAIGAAAAYAVYFGIVSGWPIAAAILFGLCVAIVLGLTSAKILEPLATRNEPLLGLLISFSMSVIIESLIAIFFGTDGKNLQSGILTVVNIGGIAIDLPGVITLVCGAVFALIVWAIVHFTLAGRLLRSVAENPSLAVSLGIPAAHVRMITYVASAVVAGVVVSLTGWHTALTPQVGFQLVVAAFIALFMGGVNDVRGTIVASYAVALIPGLIIAYSTGLSEDWRLVLVFCVAALSLAIRPNGMFTKKLRTT